MERKMHKNGISLMLLVVTIVIVLILVSTSVIILMQTGILKSKGIDYLKKCVQDIESM